MIAAGKERRRRIAVPGNKRGGAIKHLLVRIADGRDRRAFDIAEVVDEPDTPFAHSDQANPNCLERWCRQFHDRTVAGGAGAADRIGGCQRIQPRGRADGQRRLQEPAAIRIAHLSPPAFSFPRVSIGRWDRGLPATRQSYVRPCGKPTVGCRIERRGGERDMSQMTVTAVGNMQSDGRTGRPLVERFLPPGRTGRCRGARGRRGDIEPGDCRQRGQERSGTVAAGGGCAHRRQSRPTPRSRSPGR